MHGIIREVVWTVYYAQLVEAMKGMIAVESSGMKVRSTFLSRCRGHKQGSNMQVTKRMAWVGRDLSHPYKIAYALHAVSNACVENTGAGVPLCGSAQWHWPFR